MNWGKEQNSFSGNLHNEKKPHNNIGVNEALSQLVLRRVGAIQKDFIFFFTFDVFYVLLLLLLLLDLGLLQKVQWFVTAAEHCSF